MIRNLLLKLLILIFSHNVFAQYKLLIEGVNETIESINPTITFGPCHKADEVFNDKSYQASKKLYTVNYLSSRKAKIYCKDNVITFEGKISEKNIKQLINIINFKVDNWDILAQATLKKAEQVVISPLFANQRLNSNIFNLKLERTRKVIDNCSSPKQLIISSEGGELTAALKLYSIVSTLNLEVKIKESGICMSACTHLPHFAKRFEIGRDSLFMFHNPNIAGIGEIKVLLPLKNDPERIASNNRVRAFWGLDRSTSNSIKGNVERFGDFFIDSKYLSLVSYPK